MQKENISVSQFYEIVIFSLDAVLQVDDSPAYDLFVVMIKLLHFSLKVPSTSSLKKEDQRTHAHFSQCEIQLCIFEHNGIVFSFISTNLNQNKFSFSSR